MRILDQDNDKSVSNIFLVLTPDEAGHLSFSLADALSRTSKGFHFHIDDKEYEHQITCMIYNEENYDTYSDRITSLIIDDVWGLSILLTPQSRP